MVLESQHTPLSGAGIVTMAPRRSWNGRHSEPGGNKHPGMAQGIEDPASSNQVMSAMSYPCKIFEVAMFDTETL